MVRSCCPSEYVHISVFFPECLLFHFKEHVHDTGLVRIIYEGADVHRISEFVIYESEPRVRRHRRTGHEFFPEIVEARFVMAAVAPAEIPVFIVPAYCRGDGIFLGNPVQIVLCQTVQDNHIAPRKYRKVRDHRIRGDTVFYGSELYFQRQIPVYGQPVRQERKSVFLFLEAQDAYSDCQVQGADDGEGEQQLSGGDAECFLEFSGQQRLQKQHNQKHGEEYRHIRNIDYGTVDRKVEPLVQFQCYVGIQYQADQTGMHIYGCGNDGERYECRVYNPAPDFPGGQHHFHERLPAQVHADEVAEYETVYDDQRTEREHDRSARIDAGGEHGHDVPHLEPPSVGCCSCCRQNEYDSRECPDGRVPPQVCHHGQCEQCQGYPFQNHVGRKRDIPCRLGYDLEQRFPVYSHSYPSCMAERSDEVFLGKFQFRVHPRIRVLPVCQEGVLYFESVDHPACMMVRLHFHDIPFRPQIHVGGFLRYFRQGGYYAGPYV